MILVLIGVLLVVCVYSVLTYSRQNIPAVTTMYKKLKPESKGGGPEVRDIITDDSDLLTEQSSAHSDSDATANDGGTVEDKCKLDSEETQQELSEVESQQENLEYTQMRLEEPSGYVNFKEDRPRLDMKNYWKRLNPAMKNDDHNDEDIFEKKKETTTGAGNKSSRLDNQAYSSSSGSRTNRKPRKPRKPRGSVGAENKGNLIHHWKQEQESQGDESQNVSDSSASVSTINLDEVPPPSKSKKPSRHITISFENSETEDLKKVNHEELQIAGVNVKFPVKPYPSQIAVMNKLIQGCKKQEHCLLESPTGSGKTLALLCGVLAWQEHIEAELRTQNIEAAQKVRDHFESKYGIEVEGAAKAITPSHEVKNGETKCCEPNQRNDVDDKVTEISEDEDQQPLLKRICRSTSPGSSCKTEKVYSEEDIFDEDDIFEETRRKRPPKIFYGSRTHKQIEQVIRELKKTAYAYKRMTILSSREFTCIQQTDGNKTEVCLKLLDPTKGLGCRFYNENTRNRISTNRALNHLGLNGPWDIEDLVELGRKESACPYFAARDLMIDAEIIFCPYNYLVDPNIRQSMQINLDGQVVILDEAHNIEEMSRDVGSLSFREDKIIEVMEEAELLRIKRKYDFETYNTIKKYLESFVQFIKINELNSVDKFSETSSSEFWTGIQLCELFDMHSLGKGIARTFESAAAAAIMDFNTAKEEVAKKQQREDPSPVITPNAKRFLEDLVLALQMMASEKLADDYRACIIESNVRDSGQVPDNTWVYRGATKRLRTLQMLCMNPAVIFAPLAGMARSVVLASGTLSPISSFQSELGTVFPHKLDANHVVPKESVYIRGIPCGPTGVQLKANYANVNSWNFQDELGRLILDVCKVIPHGVLCFFSSYSMMQKQIDRWKQNSCWAKLEEVKHVLQEPRGSSNLEPVMQEFREVIQSTSEGPRNGITGALLLAVFRGKVAEGIDFSDNEARCVMAIGIPYAVRKDPSVDMKFNYNNLNQPKGLLKGGEWYAVQAFRALNQALGRCVRHRNDWGAVLLIDQRFLEKSSYNYLPKWVKTMWRSSPRFNLIQELQQFVARQINSRENEKSDT